jgi:hypothetical protein
MGAVMKSVWFDPAPLVWIVPPVVRRSGPPARLYVELLPEKLMPKIFRFESTVIVFEPVVAPKMAVSMFVVPDVEPGGVLGFQFAPVLQLPAAADVQLASAALASSARPATLIKPMQILVRRSGRPSSRAPWLRFEVFIGKIV